MIPRIRSASIRNYKSIEADTVTLGPFTVLVGRNGTGKSNFVDALAFVSDSLSESVEFAFHKRGGIAAVRRCSLGRPTNISISLDIQLERNVEAEYSFEIAARAKEKFAIAHEKCVVKHFFERQHVYEVEKGAFKTPIAGIRPQLVQDRLVLFAASATPEFRPVYDFLTGMAFYSIVPDKLRELQRPDPGVSLNPDGSNAAAVLKRLRGTEKGRRAYERLCRLVAKAVSGIKSIEHQPVGNSETLRFIQDVGLNQPWTFEALTAC